ncbi:hypothetical protein PIB30_112898, partial [Stylosanthes scabra]|nr:hypothetical protein [Stylosanthes scabra]
ILKQSHSSIKKLKSRQHLQDHNQRNQSKENLNKSFTCFKKTRNFRQMKKVTKKTIQMKTIVSESTLMMT